MCFGLEQILSIGVDCNKFNSAQSLFNHLIDCVASGTTDSNGNAAGGSSSPYLLRFASVNPANGTFTFTTGFCSSIINGGTGSALKAGLPNGQYQFQAYYTKDAGYDDYFSSNYITVTVQD